ncbi:unnamed protein product, partial [Bubo scandiacus]
CYKDVQSAPGVAEPEPWAPQLRGGRARRPGARSPPTDGFKRRQTLTVCVGLVAGPSSIPAAPDPAGPAVADVPG